MPKRFISAVLKVTNGEKLGMTWLGPLRRFVLAHPVGR